MSSMTGHRARDRVEDPWRRWQPGRYPAAIELLGRSLASLLLRPVHAVQTAGQAVPRFGNVLLGMGRGRLPGPVVTVPRTRFNGAITPHRSVEGRHWPLDRFREIKNRRCLARR